MANTAQIEYWNAAPGQKWVTFQKALDHHMAPLTNLLFAQANVQSGEAVLDIGCGTGETVIRLATKVGRTGSVLGIDVSEPLLSAARARCAKLALDNVALVRADAQTVRLQARRFDLLLSRFGVMFFENPKAAFHNLLGATRPGGRLCFVCWGPFENNPWFRVPLDAAVRRLGAPDPVPPHAPGPLAFSDRDYLQEVIASAGWDDIVIECEAPAMTGFSTPEAEASFVCKMGPASRLIAERNADEEAIREIRADISTRFAAYAGPEGIRIPTSLQYVQARRP